MFARASKAPLQCRPVLLWAFLLLLAGALVAPAFAQLGTTVDLRDSDLAMARAAAAKLYENLDTPIGASEAWDNTATGNRGTAMLVSRSEPNGVQCRRIQHVIQVRGRGDPFIFLFDHCLIDGTWKTFP